MPAARLPDQPGSLQHDLEVHQFRPQRGIEHAAADLDHQAAEQRGVDLGVEPHVLAVGRLERCFQCGELPVVERRRRLHFSRHLAAMERELLAETLDHVLGGEQATVARHHLEEVAGRGADRRPIHDGAERALLLLGGKRRAFHEAGEVGALLQHRLKLAEVLVDLVELVLLAGEFKKRRGVAPRNTRRHLIVRCHFKRSRRRP